MILRERVESVISAINDIMFSNDVRFEISEWLSIKDEKNDGSFNWIEIETDENGQLKITK